MGAGVSMVPGEASGSTNSNNNQQNQNNEANMKNKDAKEISTTKTSNPRRQDNEVSVRAEPKASVRIKPGDGPPKASGNNHMDAGKRRVSLQECFTPASSAMISPRESVFDPNSTHITVGDIVRVEITPDKVVEGIIVERLDNDEVTIELGDRISVFPLSRCHILLRNDEYEVGDKVEVQPLGSSLFFVGKVIALNAGDRTLDVLMDGDDPDDIERNIPFDNARKLMSRRGVVVNRWKKAFMLVVASNFFRQVEFDETTISERYT